MADILLVATAGIYPDQMADTNHVRYPRIDYLELQKLIDIDILNYSVYENHPFGSIIRRLETQLRSDLYLTLLGYLRKHKYPLVFAMSERVGIPFAGLQRLFAGKKPFISMIHSWSQRQEIAWSKLNLFATHDAIVVHCRSMKSHLTTVGANSDQIHVIPFSVDHRFFSPIVNIEPNQGYAISVGEPRTRDYSTLFKAVADLPMNLLVAASGSWYAREKKTAVGTIKPDNVTLTRNVPLLELKRLYSKSQFVILPLRDSIASYGLTVILEAASMARPVIAFHSRGIQDFIINGETGILVEAGSQSAMKEAIQYLLCNPQEAKRMGQNARQRVEEELNQARYVQDIARLLSSRLKAIW